MFRHELLALPFVCLWEICLKTFFHFWNPVNFVQLVVQKWHSAPLRVRRVCLPRFFSFPVLSANIIPQLAIYQSLIWSSLNGWMRCHACLLKCSCGERGVLALGIWCIFSPSTAFICLLLWLNLHTYFLRHQRRLLAYVKMSQARTLQWYSQPLLNLLNCVCETVLLLSCSHMTSADLKSVESHVEIARAVCMFPGAWKRKTRYQRLYRVSV